VTAPALAPGTRIGPYVVIETLGSGASATAWRATDPDGREVAVKVRRAGIVSLDRRFLREFESMRTLRIPGVVRVYEAGLDDDLLWFSMDIVRGATFLEAMHAEKDVAVRVTKVLELGRQLLDILAGLHQAGLVHRDIKPSNVLVTDDGQVRVLDFGVARFYGDVDTLSDSGQVLGTVPFMAPEQLAGLPFDHRIDLFAAGVMLYEAIDGARPRPQTTVGWIPRICLERLCPLACLHKEVPRGLSAVIESLTRVNPADRPSSLAAAREMRRIAGGETRADWPEPPWVDRGDWVAELEAVPGQMRLAPVQIVEGPSGSGRSRVGEQVHRHAVMQGIRPLHVTCRIDAVGTPILALLEAVLGGSDDPGWAREVIGDDADVLRRMWPQLPPPEGGAGPAPAAAEVAAAAARAIARSTGRRALLLIVHDLEQADEITAGAIAKLAISAGSTLGMLLLHESRWESTASRLLIASLRAKGAGFRVIPALDDDQATAIAQALCPKVPLGPVSASTPERAVELGLEALAKWRGEPWGSPDSGLWPLAVRDAPVPEAVFARIAGPRAVEDPRLRLAEGHVSFVGDAIRRTATHRLVDRRDAARSLAEAWAQALGPKADPADIACLRLLSAEPAVAREPAIRAALEAAAIGRFGDARRYLALSDGLGPGGVDGRFDVAALRARVALRTEAGPPRVDLVDACETLARVGEEDAWTRILRGEFQLRAGEARPALVSSLRLAGQLQGALPLETVRALLVATEARFQLGQLDEARPQLDRARAILAEHPDPKLEVEVANWLSELLFRKGDLAGCRALLQDTIRLAGETGYVRGAAFAAGRFARVLRALGRRPEAEHQMRAAREAFQDTADLMLDIDACLELAMLRAERADAAGAHHLLDDAIRRAAGLRVQGQLARAMRVALAIAVVRGDSTDAMMALSTVESSDDPEAPAVLVRWFRTRGDGMRAMDVPGPSKDQLFGHTLWKVERARAALIAGDRWVADTEADEALEIAMRHRLGEVAVLARLILGVLRPVDEASWRELQRLAASSLFAEVYLGAIELDARRMHANGDKEGARARWTALRARSEELGYRPGVEEAAGWLQGDRG
jgi:hypothetical protein